MIVTPAILTSTSQNAAWPHLRPKFFGDYGAHGLFGLASRLAREITILGGISTLRIDRHIDRRINRQVAELRLEQLQLGFGAGARLRGTTGLKVSSAIIAPSDPP